ncbi:MAG: cation:proton antiporter [Dehalococcoidia bacterium]
MAAYAMFVGAGLSVTAFPVMAHMLREKRLLGTEMGAIGVGAAAAITVLMFIAVAAAAAIGRGQGVATFKLAGPPYSPLQAAVLTVAFIAALVFLVRPLLARFAQTLDPERGISAEFLAVTFLGVFLCGAIGDRIGITQWVGSFLFGTVMPLRLGVRRKIIDQLDGISTILLVPIFLAFSGIRTNLRLLTWELVPGILLFLVTMILAKVIIGTLASRAVGLQWRQSAVLGVLLNCRGLLVLAVALIGLQLNVITPQMQLIFVMGAIVTTLMTGPLFDMLYRPTTERPPAERDAAPLTPRPAAGRPSAASAPGRARADRER